MSDHTSSSNGAPEPHGSREGKNGSTDEIFVPEEDFQESRRISAQHIDPPELQSIEPHMYGSVGIGYTRTDRSNRDRLGHSITKTMYAEDSGTAIHQAVRNRLSDVTLPRLVDVVKGRVQAETISPLPENFVPEDGAARTVELKKFASSSSLLTREVAQVASETVREQLSAIHDLLVAQVKVAPRATKQLIVSVQDSLKQQSAGGPDPQIKIRKLEALVARFQDVAARSSEITSDVLRLARTRFAAEMRKADNAAIDATLGRMCIDALRKVLPRAIDQFTGLNREANTRALHQQFVLEALVPSRPTAASTDTDISGGRAVTLPDHTPEELLARALASRGVSDLDELTRSYRDELGAAVSPETEGEARALAARIRRMVAVDCGNDSIYSLIKDEAEARKIAGEVYPKAHPFVSLRLTSEELGVCTTRVEHVELPLTDNPAYIPIRKAFVDELTHLSGNRIGVVDRPAGVASIRVVRAVCGYPSQCDRTNDPLLAAYRLLQPLKFDPHPFRSPVKPFLDRLGHNGKHP